MTDIYQKAEWLINIPAGLLVAYFTWLRLSGAKLVPFARVLPADVILQITLALYYACWVAGTIVDTKTQKRVYPSQPNRGRIPWKGIGIGLSISAAFGVLCLVHSFEQFAAVLTGFFVLNVGAWLYLIRIFLPLHISDSRKRRGDEPFKLEQIDLVYEQYLCGRWQWLRFGAGGIILLVLDAAAWTSVADYLAQRASLGSRETVLALLTLTFVVVMETWIWSIRYRVKTALRLLDYLDDRYVATPLPA